jgi:hypothetical protein
MPSRDLVKQNALLQIQVSDLQRRIVQLETELRVTRGWKEHGPKPMEDRAAHERLNAMREPVRIPPNCPVMAVPI